MTILNIDVDQTCFDKSGKPTPYFEDLWFQLIESMGGENSNTAEDAFDLASFSIESANIRSRLTKVSNLVDGIETADVDEIPYNQLASLRKRINAIEAQLNPVIPLKSIHDRLSSIEAQL